MTAPKRYPFTVDGPARHRVWPLWVRNVGVLSICGCLLGCGRKATAEDCQRIVKRIAELELANVVPQTELNVEVEQAQNAFRDRALSDCVGRRITEASLECVANAKTAASVIDDCFD
jgi:hypothetical protein